MAHARAVVASIVLVVFVTIGGIYLGLFTPIEASGFGACFTLLVALVRRKLSWPVMKAIVLQTMRTTATVFLILMGAYVFIPFMTLSQLPEIVVRFLLSFDLGTTGILIIIILTYLALGTFMEDFSMLILTLPVVMPVLKALGVDLVWFGVVAVLIIQMGLLSPPVGINVFIVKGIVPDVPMYTIFRGIWPFWYAMGLLIVAAADVSAARAVSAQHHVQVIADHVFTERKRSACTIRTHRGSTPPDGC